MTVKEYIQNLKSFIKENPEVLEMQAITSMDDEGNGFNPIIFSPTKGVYKDGDFISADSLKKLKRDESKINSVCVN